MTRMRMFSSPSAALAAALVALQVAGCTPRVDTRGNLPEPEKVAAIEVGRHTERDVETILGSPSSIGAFDGAVWLYLSQRTETVAFFAPEVKMRMVVAVRFDDKGVVREVRTLGLDDGRPVELVRRET
ncbi:MAG: outer membrane protein assembly factor BamE, partial [Alphaproteobacteria bacterium]|nr:outer membrane protein assembly factor BamE [Alphaproteobacteria bacterium]